MQERTSDQSDGSDQSENIQKGKKKNRKITIFYLVYNRKITIFVLSIKTRTK